jgi:hypothetical protein
MLRSIPPKTAPWNGEIDRQYACPARPRGWKTARCRYVGRPPMYPDAPVTRQRGSDYMIAHLPVGHPGSRLAAWARRRPNVDHLLRRLP